MIPRQLSELDFEELRNYIHKLCGLYLQPEKRYLILQRLEPLLEELDCESFAEFNSLLRASPSKALHDRIIAAMTTNETSFFRDQHPFEAFAQNLLPALATRLQQQRAAGNNEPGRIWSTAVSTGQEAYSLAICILEFLQTHGDLNLQPQDFRILATDVSPGVLARAAGGEFNDVEMARGLSEQRRERFFTRQGRTWRVNQEVRERIEFRRMNLIEPVGIYQAFDVIFCRNVLIYFDDDTKRKIIELLYRKLHNEGVLVLGSAENLYNLTLQFRSDQVGCSMIYRKNL